LQKRFDADERRIAATSQARRTFAEFNMLEDRARGCLLGLAVGDALGTTLEFLSRDTYPPLTDMSAAVHSTLHRGNGGQLQQVSRTIFNKIEECALIKSAP
jgi:ADP-ribosylglycohydrolase